MLRGVEAIIRAKGGGFVCLGLSAYLRIHVQLFGWHRDLRPPDLFYQLGEGALPLVVNGVRLSFACTILLNRGDCKCGWRSQVP